MTASELLEIEIERALAKYLGGDYPLPTQEWANVASLFTDAIVATQVRVDNPDECIDNGFETADRAKLLVYRLGQLLHAMSAVVE